MVAEKYEWLIQSELIDCVLYKLFPPSNYLNIDFANFHQSIYGLVSVNIILFSYSYTVLRREEECI